MLEKKDIDKIKEVVEEFFEKMTVAISDVTIASSIEKTPANDQGVAQEDREVVSLDIKTDEPQILIGQQGQTLFEIQRLLRTILSRKLQNIFYFNLDINEYKKKKIEYLKDLARELANQVATIKEEKVLPPMSSYERRIIHAELAQRTDVTTESRGDGFDRCVVIKVRQ
jgi:spoIIIJ-associated protein